jgi:hypothetical protein
VLTCGCWSCFGEAACGGVKGWSLERLGDKGNGKRAHKGWGPDARERGVKGMIHAACRSLLLAEGEDCVECVEVGGGRR